MSLMHAIRARAHPPYVAARAYARGYRFGNTSGIPAPPVNEAPTPPPGHLESYFDKHTTGPGIWKWRHYFPIYEKHLGQFVGQSPAVLEIGIYSGGSLGMWHDYFGDGLHLHGIDIEPACRAYQDRAHVLIGDQSDPEFLRSVIQETSGGLDVIIDDGGHQAYQQIASLETLFPHLRAGGVYICEDVHRRNNAFQAYMAGLMANLHATPGGMSSPASPIQAAINSVSVYPFVVVIEKRQQPLNRLEAPKHGTQWQPFYEEAYQVAGGRS